VLFMLGQVRSHVFVIAAGTLLAVLSLVSIVQLTDPAQTGILTYFFLYLSILLTIVGSVTLLGLLFRYKYVRNLYIVNLVTSIRQGLLISLFVVVGLFLGVHGLWFWWTALILALFLMCVEVFFNVA
jgi:hypothetical protein